MHPCVHARVHNYAFAHTQVSIGEDARGRVDLRDLDAQLARFASSGRFLIGAFSAASNVTGVCADTERIAAALHRCGVLVHSLYFGLR